MRPFQASVLVAPLAVLFLLSGSLLGTQRLAFRDVSHFYTPLYDYLADRQTDQWIPLWNPLDNMGIPLAGETTTAVFYPMRMAVFALPFDAEVAMAWYVALHLILAALNCGLVARWSGLSQPAASIAAVAYGLSGSIVFLHTNPPFLVGAAWLPIVIGSLLCRQGPIQKIRIPIAGVALAMMILGGDPHTAVHALMVVCFAWTARWMRGAPSPVTFRGVLCCSLLAAIMAAPQIAASLDWSRQSDRISPADQPDTWFAAPHVGSRKQQAFEYSLPPWHILELFSPNAFGALFPANERISQTLRADGRMWTPSIYMGMLVAMALSLRLWRWRRDGVDLWTAVAVLSLAFALGNFGLIWWLQAMTGGLVSIDSAVGGPYWLAYHFLPGYDSLRYPAKWLSLFALAASLSTASFLDRETCRERLRKLSLPLLITLLFTTLLMWVGKSSYALVGDALFGQDMIAEARLGQSTVLRSSWKDEFWGPLQMEAALTSITTALVHGCLVLTALNWVLRKAKSRKWSNERILTACLIVLVVDTTFAARHLVLETPSVIEDRLVDQYDASKDPRSRRWMRTVSGAAWPRDWSESTSVDRAIEVKASVRVAWFGRWHLPQGQAVLNNMVSIRSQAIEQFWRSSNNLTRNMSPAARRAYWNSIRRWLNISGGLITTDRTRNLLVDLQHYQLVDCIKTAESNRDAMQIHHTWRSSTRTVADPEAMRQILLHVAFSKGNPVPTIQTSSGEASPDRASPAKAASVSESVDAQSGQSSVIMTAQSSFSETAEFEVDLVADALLTRDVFQDGNWIASYQSDGNTQWIAIDVQPVDFLIQGVVLPSGKHRVRFEYRPWWLGMTLAFALAGWLGVVIYLPMQNRLNTRSRMSSV